MADIDPSLLMDITPLQVIGLWEDLLSCLYGNNGYGGDVAEIYLYRFMPHSPAAHHNQDGWISELGLQLYRDACRRLHALCHLFAERNEVTVTFADDSPLDSLLDDEPHTHRVHLRVRARN